jgi:glycosyltransferase involved in cell wall biosynthesis
MTEGSTPFFSIVIPTYNRANLLGRALKSALGQTFRDFEIVVVDDGSRDNTFQLVKNFNDNRIQFLRHPNNRGVCPARNTGVDQARGEWIIFLDSDDELLPEALNTLAMHADQVPNEVARLAGMYQWDDGGYSPIPKPTGQILDYEGYIRWSNMVGRSDFHNCIRRATFSQVKLPENRAYENIYHLEFARQFKTMLLPDVVALAHQDASNHIINLGITARVRKVLQDAPDGLSSVETILTEHGNALKELAPARWRIYCRTRILYAYLAGHRKHAGKYGLVYLSEIDLSASVIGAMVIGSIGPVPLAWAQAMRKG